MKRISWNVVDFELKYPEIDYSEIITEPGLVLSMREIYNRYAAAGVDLLNGELVPDDDDLESDMYDPEVEDKVDILAHASALRNGATEELRRKSKRSARTKDESPEETDHSDESTEDEAKRKTTVDESE